MNGNGLLRVQLFYSGWFCLICSCLLYTSRSSRALSTVRILHPYAPILSEHRERCSSSRMDTFQSILCGGLLEQRTVSVKLLNAKHQLSGLIDVPTAQGDHHIARFSVGEDVVLNLLKGIKPDAAGDLFAEILRINIVGVFFPRTHNLGQNNPVGNLEHLDKIVEQQLGTGIGKGLEHCPDPLKGQLFRCLQRLSLIHISPAVTFRRFQAGKTLTPSLRRSKSSMKNKFCWIKKSAGGLLPLAFGRFSNKHIQPLSQNGI